MLKNHNILTLRINTTNISNFSSNAAIYCHAGPLYPFTYLEVKIRENAKALQQFRLWDIQLLCGS